MRSRSARARGLRTLQHQTLPTATCYAIDTEVWLRSLVIERSGAGVDRRWATKDQVYDEAIGWFLAQHEREPVLNTSVRQRDGADLTFWLDSKLMIRARRMAARDGLKLAQLIEIALADYVKRHLSEELLVFRRRTHEEAGRLYGAPRSALQASRVPRSTRHRARTKS